MVKTGPKDIELARRATYLRGLWYHPSKPTGTYFYLTRLSETEPAAYGWYCDGAGEMLPGTPLVKLTLNSRGTAPAGFRRVS